MGSRDCTMYEVSQHIDSSVHVTKVVGRVDGKFFNTDLKNHRGRLTWRRLKMGTQVFATKYTALQIAIRREQVNISKASRRIVKLERMLNRP